MTDPQLRVDHIGIAVEDLADARERFAKLFGLSPSPIEDVPAEGVRVSFFDLGGCRIELLEGIGAESPVRRFLDKRHSGVHHVSIALEGGDIDAHFAELSRRGVRVLGEGPAAGSEGSKVFFVHPGAASGILFEFSQKKGERK